MAEYLFTVKDRQTGEILCQGTKQECADYIGCDESYIRGLIRTQPEYKGKTKYSEYKVERQVFGEIKHGGARKSDVTCMDCGLLMKNASATRKRCPECQRKHHLEENKHYMREVRNTTVAKPKKTKKGETGCEGCVYFFADYAVNNCCNYIFIKDKPRPCPPGKDCTVKIERKGYREKKERSTDIS